MLSKTQVKARPSVLWCYHKDLGFSTHRKKRLKQIQKLKQRGLYDAKNDNNFDLFISSTNIRYLYYKESESILGQTYGMLVLQDFSALTPNMLARTVETVEGGGVVIILLNKMSSLSQFYHLTMQAHKRYETEMYNTVKPRFNERFLLSLSKCKSCLVLDDELNVLPISKYMKNLKPVEEDESDRNKAAVTLVNLKKDFVDNEPIGHLVSIAKTYDQATCLLKCLDVMLNRRSLTALSSAKALDQFVTITSGRGRGKSALLGMICAAAIAFGLDKIFITAPSPENLNTVFKFLVTGLEAMRYRQHLDFEIIQQSKVATKSLAAILRINVFRASDKKVQFVQYVSPQDHSLLNRSDADLLLVDEAAAIPLPIIKALMFGSKGYSGFQATNPLGKLVFLSSTITGYEGTGRSLSLKLISDLRKMEPSTTAKKGKEENDWRTNEFMFKKNLLKKLAHKKGKEAKEASEKEAKEREVEEEFDPFSDNKKRLIELRLEEPIRYAAGDRVEKWLQDLLCIGELKSSTPSKEKRLPHPDKCELYAVDRDTLFSFRKLSEKFLKKIVDIYTSAHYKNSPDDLLLLADNPSHRLFVLIEDSGMFPMCRVLC